MCHLGQVLPRDIDIPLGIQMTSVILLIRLFCNCLMCSHCFLARLWSPANQDRTMPRPGYVLPVYTGEMKFLLRYAVGSQEMKFLWCIQ